MKTLVIGGTGTVGSRTVGELIARGGSVRVLSRDASKLAALPAGAEPATGDLQKPETLPSAFAGMDALFLATALAPDETTQGLNAVEAAKAAGLRYIVYMSVHRADEAVHVPHFASKLPIEGAVKMSGIPYTVLRPNNFFQNDLWFRDPMLQAGLYPQPLSRRGLSRVDVRDIAEAAAHAIESGKLANRTLALVGPGALTGEQVAELWAKALGRPIQYIGADMDAWYEQARKLMPYWMALDLRIMYTHFLEHGLVATPSEIEELTAALGHPPRAFEAFVGETAAEWKK
jgi:uncharacterized protein YbjT (DUF2867 family)